MVKAGSIPAWKRGFVDFIKNACMDVGSIPTTSTFQLIGLTRRLSTWLLREQKGVHGFDSRLVGIKENPQSQ